jgi:hypothetical protein
MSPESEGYMPEEELMEKRFGVVALEKEFISRDQLLEALEIQIDEEIEQGERRVIGMILVEKGYMDLSQVQETLELCDIE